MKTLLTVLVLLGFSALNETSQFDFRRSYSGQRPGSGYGLGSPESGQRYPTSYQTYDRSVIKRPYPPLRRSPQSSSYSYRADRYAPPPTRSYPDPPTRYPEPKRVYDSPKSSYPDLRKGSYPDTYKQSYPRPPKRYPDFSSSYRPDPPKRTYSVPKPRYDPGPSYSQTQSYEDRSSKSYDKSNSFYGQRAPSSQTNVNYGREGGYKRSYDPCTRKYDGEFVLDGEFRKLFPYVDNMCYFIKCANKKAFLNACSPGTRNNKYGEGFCSHLDLEGYCGQTVYDTYRSDGKDDGYADKPAYSETSYGPPR